MALTIGRRQTLAAQAFKGVRDVLDPYSLPPNLLAKARNCYLPDPGSGCGVYARPGFQLQNAGNPLADADSGRIGQGVVTATIADGTQLNFCVCGGKLYRIEAGLTGFTDVTPSNVTINPTSRVSLTPYSNRLAITDDVNVPWIASDLQNTPVTGTLINYTADASAWRAYGPARVYDGALVFVVRFGNGESRTARIAWSEPDDPFTGYEQTDFDNQWDVVENNTGTIYALWPTNQALYYLRSDTIGYASGVIGVDFQTTATRDAVDDAIGTRAPASVTSYGNTIYFADAEGRPQSFTIGGGLQPLWLQMRRVVEAAPTGFHDVTARTACAVLVPELDLVLFALWSPDASQLNPQLPTTLYAFQAATGRYVGEWTIGSGIAVHTMGIIAGADGEKVLAMLGSSGAGGSTFDPSDSGYLWTLSALEDGLWTDNGAVPDLLVTTAPLGYQADLVLNVDRVVAIVEELETDADPASIDLDAG